VQNNKLKKIVRKTRGAIYRRLPVFSPFLFRKKLAGYERRWDLENRGFTKEEFFKILSAHFALSPSPAWLFELAAGDGLVGSLGLWLEQEKSGWRICAWEHRPKVLAQLRKNRPATEIHEGRLIRWEPIPRRVEIAAVTTRGAREAGGVCRAIRRGTIRPHWLGIWNPSRRPVWYRRLRHERYRLELVWQNIEFYRPQLG